ncbi:MAG: hypothetical protein LBF62_13190 [Tannerellaceae bacterium]|jgi:hypothetical protein|nr:hypothetical protein [Tannerellaceae bacterium]
MKTYIKINALWLLFALSPVAGLQAQVSVGSLLPAEKAALLQIKDYDAAVSGGATANGGLLLPRVELEGISDVTFIQSPNADQRLDLTGLLVYNVKTSGGMEKGIYEWDGSSWNLLEAESKHAGSVTTTKIEDASTPIAAGNFEFQIDPSTKRSQCRLTKVPSGNVTYYYNITGLWSTDKYSYASSNISFTTTNYATWQYLHADGGNDRRYEMWIVDSYTNNTYHVQFINVSNLTNPLYMLLVTKY